MVLRYVSDGLHLDRKDLFGREAPVPWRPSTDSGPLFLVHTGDNSAGNGGDGYFAGSLIDRSYAAFEPLNIAQAGSHATASAHQSNIGIFDQAATQIAGAGGDGGDWNAAMGGSAGVFGLIGSDVIATGDNSAGNGGNGHFSGALVHAPVAVFDPINMAVAGFHGTADAHQANTVQFLQGASQAAGGGGHGGNHNAASGGGVSVFAAGAPDHSIVQAGHASDHNWNNSDLIASGGNHAGDSGDGYFYGSMIHASFALYDPINISVAGYNSNAHADQTNNVIFDQSAFQMAGIGGNGGSGNEATGGDVSGAGHNWISSDMIATGGNHAGDGGDGYFYGGIVHASFAVYSPINIAVAGYNSSAHADQTNNVIFDQSAFQMAGVGGNGGNGNAATGGDVSGAGHNWINSDMIATGGNHAGDGGDGYFYGGMVHASFALYDPINIAVAGYNSSAHADQTNNVIFDQSAFQMAGVGGNGGNGNAAAGGDAGLHSSVLGLIGSDVIATGGNSAGSGGDGHFAGSLIDLNIAIYAPINIAVAGPNSTAEAHQTNNVEFDQSAIQIAGIGGDGGHGNTAVGGDFAMHLLADHHLLLGHA